MQIIMEESNVENFANVLTNSSTCIPRSKVLQYIQRRTTTLKTQNRIEKFYFTGLFIFSFFFPLPL